MNKQKIALITGTTRGIGREVAIQLAKDKVHVIITGRTIGALEELHDEIEVNNGSSTIVQMDLNDFKSINNLSKSITERWGKLDILVANAAYLHNLTPLSHLEYTEWQKSINVNINSVWMLIKNFEQLLLKSNNGRAVLITSGAALGARPFWGAYAVSKAALEAMGRAWAAEMNETNLKINLFDPGATKTNMRAKAYPGENQKSLKDPKEAAKYIVKICSHKFYQNGERLNYQDMKN